MPEVSDDVVNGFNAKLEAFNETLSAEEQDLLGSLIAQASVAGDEDVSGFSFQMAKPSARLGSMGFELRTNLVSVGLGSLKSPVIVMGW